MKRTNNNIFLSTQLPPKFSFGTWGQWDRWWKHAWCPNCLNNYIESGCAPCGRQEQSIDIMLHVQQVGKIVPPKSGHEEIQLRKAIESAPSTSIDRHRAVWPHTAVDHWPWDRQHVPSKPKICTTCVGSVIFPTWGRNQNFPSLALFFAEKVGSRLESYCLFHVR